MNKLNKEAREYYTNTLCPKIVLDNTASAISLKLHHTRFRPELFQGKTEQEMRDVVVSFLYSSARDGDFPRDVTPESMDHVIRNMLPHMQVREPMISPYTDIVAFQDTREGKFLLSNIEQHEFTMENYGRETIRDDEGIAIPLFALNTKPYVYPAIREDGQHYLWMSATRGEIESMEIAVEEATGDVLVLGCGLGYYPYEIAQKEDVTSIVIIEFDPNVIKLFNEHILPKIPNNHKITILEADAIKYCETHDLHSFDYIFADIWIESGDWEAYVKLKPPIMQSGVPSNFWIEDALLHTIRNFVLQQISYVVRGRKYLTNASTSQRKLLNHLGCKEASTIDDIKRLCDLEYIRVKLGEVND